MSNIPLDKPAARVEVYDGMYLLDLTESEMEALSLLVNEPDHGTDRHLFKRELNNLRLMLESVGKFWPRAIMVS